MGKIYTALGLMSGTSMDGVDASVIQTDGKSKYKAILDRYFEYPMGIYKNLTALRDKINSSKDLKKHKKHIKSVEKEITIFHAKAVNEILKKKKAKIDFIGFHGQTIYHNAKKKITRQLGDGKLLSKLTKKAVVYNFRQNDLKNGGQGAPLTPIFHGLIAHQHRFVPPNIFVNIGGITNITYLGYQLGSTGTQWHAQDLCLGNCLIDKWIRTHSKKSFDEDGKIALSGKINKTRLNNGLTNYYDSELYWGLQNRSLDVKDFDLSFVDGLSLKDGAATLTEYTADIFVKKIHDQHNPSYENEKIILTGGGRKNKFLIRRIREKTTHPILLIDDFGINGDFIESQAFAYLAIRSYLKLPISFFETTGAKKACTGGVIVKNF